MGMASVSNEEKKEKKEAEEVVKLEATRDEVVRTSNGKHMVQIRFGVGEPFHPP